jgi:phosphatidate cytidylyltransferase
VVWLTDTGAYVTGRALGGPKLAPAISPNKTWTGFFGGLVAGALVGLVAGAFWPGHEPASMTAASVGLALAAQAGDLFESSLKRRFGVKDSSRLIPGHGGLLDRVDSLLIASLVVSLFYWIETA